jgi:hypothetical protein
MAELRVPGERPVTTAGRTDSIVAVMEREGAHPAYVHAARVCGYVVTQNNEHLYDDMDLDRWDSAIDEWCLLNPGASEDF